MTKRPEIPIDQRLALRVSEAAALLGLSRAQTYELVAAGDLPSVKLGGAIRIPRRELEAYLASVTERGRGVVR